MDSNEKKDPIDLTKILLPQKDAQSPASAQRVNAGILLEQEQKASVEGLPEPKLPEKSPGGGVPSGAKPDGVKDFFQEVSAVGQSPKKETSSIKPLQTYQGDIESLVEKKNVSVVSIAAAEADKPKAQSVPLPDFQTSSTAPLFTRTLMTIGGVLMLALAGGVVAYVLLAPHTVPVTSTGSTTPFITVDDTVVVPLGSNATRVESMKALETARKNIKITLGLIERMYVTKPTGDATNSTVEVPAAELLTRITPFVPQALLRTLSPTYLLGVHSFDENSAFLILHTDSYETAYAAMLQWESGMQADLAPFFSRVPPVHVGAATSTASTTANPVFVDKIVENKDARVIQTPQGDILLMWTFLDRNTLAITTNEYTLREIISRITRAPQTGLPQ